MTEAEFASAVGAALDAAERLRPGAAGTPTVHRVRAAHRCRAVALPRARRRLRLLEVGHGRPMGRDERRRPRGRRHHRRRARPHRRSATRVEADRRREGAHHQARRAPVLGPGTAGVEAVFLARAESCARTHAPFAPRRAPSPVAEALTVRFEVTARPTAPGGWIVLDVRGAHGDYRGLTLRRPVPGRQRRDRRRRSGGRARSRARRRRVAAALAQRALPGRFELVRAARPWWSTARTTRRRPRCWPRRSRGVAGSARGRCSARCSRRQGRRRASCARSRRWRGGFVATRAASARALPADDLAELAERHRRAAARRCRVRRRAGGAGRPASAGGSWSPAASRRPGRRARCCERVSAGDGRRAPTVEGPACSARIRA